MGQRQRVRFLFESGFWSTDMTLSDQELLDSKEGIFKARFNGSFDVPSAYTQPLSREVEDLWAQYWPGMSHSLLKLALNKLT
jgi:hypothetical protein